MFKDETEYWVTLNGDGTKLNKSDFNTEINVYWHDTEISTAYRQDDNTIVLINKLTSG